jgi:hypothetical protein
LIQGRQQLGDRIAHVTAVIERGALNQTRQVRVLGEVIEEAIQDRIDNAALCRRAGPGRRRRPAALGEQRNYGLQAARQHRFVKGALVAEVMIQARLILEAGIECDPAHGHAGKAALGEVAFRRVENERPCGRCLVARCAAVARQPHAFRLIRGLIDSGVGTAPAPGLPGGGRQA